MRSGFAKMQRLNVAEYLSVYNWAYYQQDSITFTPTVIGLVKRCGPFVRELSFGARWFKITQPVFDAISESVPHSQY